ncbi:MAG TPA: flavin reductase family protein [Fimbriimonadaceae bacterium]|nr:flavin reductase family protein [Fimbriimonadaceae bacterium]
MEFQTYTVESLVGVEAYDLLVGLIQPRPIALVSTLSSEGTPNLAPFSFFMAGGSNPPSLAISVTASARGDKDTLRNIEATGEFVVNLVTREMAEGMNQTAASSGSADDDWLAAGFTAVDSIGVQPKRVLESPAQFECRLFQVVRHGEGIGAARYILGAIETVHVRHESTHDLIARLGGPHYLDLATMEKFELG